MAKTNGKTTRKRATRSGAKPRATERESRAELDRVTAAVRAAAPPHMKPWAQEQLRRELAVWVSALRSQLEVIQESVRDVLFAARDETHLLHGLIDAKRLMRVHLELQNVDSELPMFTFPCPLPDVLAVAAGYQANWLAPVKASN